MSKEFSKDVEIREIQESLISLQERADKLLVIDPKTQEVASDMRGEALRSIKIIEARRKFFTEPQNIILKSLNTIAKNAKLPFEDIALNLKRKYLNYEQKVVEEKRIAEVTAKRIIEEAATKARKEYEEKVERERKEYEEKAEIERKEHEEEAEKVRIAYEEEIEREKKEHGEEAATKVRIEHEEEIKKAQDKDEPKTEFIPSAYTPPPPTVPVSTLPPIEKAIKTGKTTSFSSDKWKAEITDEIVFMKWASENEEWQYLKIDTKVLNQLAKIKKSNQTVPGIRFWNDTTLATRV